MLTHRVKVSLIKKAPVLGALALFIVSTFLNNDLNTIHIILWVINER